MPGIEMICLANSRKYSGRCVAGLKTDGTGWIRPVGNNLHKILLPKHYRLTDGTEAGVLDVLRMDVVEPQPERHHPENWLISGARWTLLSRPAPRDAVPILRAHLTRGPDLLGGQTDRLPYQHFARFPAAASLALVYPHSLRWSITVTPPNKRRTRTLFLLNGAEYDLAVTDPEWEHRLHHLGPGIYPRDAAAGVRADDRLLFTVSLSEPLGQGQWCYKLVAAVFVVPTAWRQNLSGGAQGTITGSGPV
jgi:hypothetical protein